MNIDAIKEDIEKYLSSDQNRKTTVILLVVIGAILTLIGVYGDARIFHFITALGISLIVGTSVGDISGRKLGWPMGLWMGLLGGALISPWVTIFLKGAEASYYAAIMGPIIGLLIGRWAEMEDKRLIEKIGFEGSGNEIKILRKKEKE